MNISLLFWGVQRGLVCGLTYFLFSTIRSICVLFDSGLLPMIVDHRRMIFPLFFLKQQVLL